MLNVFCNAPIWRSNPHTLERLALKTEEYLIQAADQCRQLAREGEGLIARLQTISHEMMAKAVELDTARDKIKKPENRRN